MHGVLKSTKSEQAIEKQKQKSQKYQQLNAAALQLNDFSLSNLDVLNQVQLIVPLDYTMWNFRQKIVLQNKSA